MQATGGRGGLAAPRLALLALLAGALYVPWCIGWAPLDPTDLTWLANDPATTFLGWAFLRAADWSFPPTWTTRLGWPIGFSTAHVDLVPLVALPLRLVEGWLPRDFQYLGLVALANGVLQAFFGLLLARRLGGGRPLVTLLGGLLFLLAPVYLNRLHGHFGLQAQWLLLAALLIYLDAAAPGGRRRALLALLLLWLAGGINSYLAVMTGLLLIAGWLRALLAGRLRGWSAAGLLAAGVVTLLASATLHGFLVPGETAGLSGTGFGLYSTNLLSLVAPSGNSWFLPDLPLADPRQAGGSGYLGLGALLLVAGATPAVLRALRQRPARQWWPLALAAGGALLFALSHRITAGPWLLLELELPTALERLANVLRASGRFVWLPHYLLLAAALWAVARWRWRSGGAALLVLAATLQLLDGRTQRDYVRWANAIGWGEPTLSSPLWQHLGAQHRHLVVLPAWQCGQAATPGGPQGFWTFGELARRERLTLNSVYLPRHTEGFLTEHCRALPERFRALGPEPDAAYALSDPVARLLAVVPLARHLCGRADGLVACRLVEGRSGVTPELQRELFQPLRAGRPERLVADSPYVALTAGWDAAVAAIVFRLPPAAGDHWLDLTCDGPTGDLLRPEGVGLHVDGWTIAPGVFTVEARQGGLSVRLGRPRGDEVWGIVPLAAAPGLPPGACAIRLRVEPS